MRRFTFEEKALAIELFKEGAFTMGAIATRLGASREGVRRWIQNNAEVKQCKAEARKLRKSKVCCQEISALLTDKYFDVGYRLISAWTNDIAGDTYQQRVTNYHENKNAADFKLLRNWKRTPALSKHIKNITRNRFSSHLDEMARCALHSK